MVNGQLPPMEDPTFGLGVDDAHYDRAPNIEPDLIKRGWAAKFLPMPPRPASVRAEVDLVVMLGGGYMVQYRRGDRLADEHVDLPWEAVDGSQVVEQDREAVADTVVLQ